MSLDVVLIPLTMAPGGFTVDVRNLSAGLVERGHHVTVIGVASPGTRLPGLPEEIEFVTLPPAGGHALAQRHNVGFGIRRELQRRPRALVQAFGCLPSYLTFASLMAARLDGRPTVWYPSLHPGRRVMWEGQGLKQLMLGFDAAGRQFGRVVDAVAVNTETEAAWFRAAGARRVEVMPPAVDDVAPLAAEARADFRRRFGLGPGPVVVVVALRDEPRKGLAFGFEAFRRAAQRVPGAQLLVIGIDSAAADPGPGAVFAGRVSDADLTASLAAADLLFVPSLYEAFSRVVIEAWQQRTPALVTDGVALAPTVRGVGGEEVPFGDVAAAEEALVRLLGDAELRDRLGTAGRRLVDERFLVPTLVDHAERLYTELWQARGGAA